MQCCMIEWVSTLALTEGQNVHFNDKKLAHLQVVCHMYISLTVLDLGKLSLQEKRIWTVSFISDKLTLEKNTLGHFSDYSHTSGAS